MLVVPKKEKKTRAISKRKGNPQIYGIPSLALASSLICLR